VFGVRTHYSITPTFHYSSAVRGDSYGKQNQTFGGVGDYEIIRALKEGAVEADGLELVVLTGHGRASDTAHGAQPRVRRLRVQRRRLLNVARSR